MDKEQLIIDYLLNELNDEDKKKAFELVQNDAEAKKIFLENRDAIIASGISLNDKPITDETINEELQKIIKPRPQYIYLSRKIIRIAAAAVIILALNITFWVVYQKGLLKKPVYTEYNVPLGSKASIVLKDSTIVWLNAGSKLRYSNNFGNTSRTVFLVGEGYFEVAKNTKKPFIVETSEVNIRALGTKFNVKAYPDDNSLETILIEGLIIVEKNDQSEILGLERGTLLRPHERITIKPGFVSETSEKKSLNTEKNKSPKKTAIFSKVENTNIYTSWKENTWEFKSEKLIDLARKLERRYDVCISFDDKTLKEESFTGKLENESLEQVMKALELSSRVKIKIDGKNVSIDRRI